MIADGALSCIRLKLSVLYTCVERRRSASDLFEAATRGSACTKLDCESSACYFDVSIQKMALFQISCSGSLAFLRRHVTFHDHKNFSKQATSDSFVLLATTKLTILFLVIVAGSRSISGSVLSWNSRLFQLQLQRPESVPPRFCQA